MNFLWWGWVFFWRGQPIGFWWGYKKIILPDVVRIELPFDHSNSGNCCEFKVWLYYRLKKIILTYTVRLDLPHPYLFKHTLWGLFTTRFVRPTWGTVCPSYLGYGLSVILGVRFVPYTRVYYCLLMSRFVTIVKLKMKAPIFKLRRCIAPSAFGANPSFEGNHLYRYFTMYPRIQSQVQDE